MATYYHFCCYNCGRFLADSSGPHEFKFENKKIVPLSHPCPDEPSDGIFLNVFCTKTMKNYRLIMIEFKKKQDSPWSAKIKNVKEQYLKNYKGFMDDTNKDSQTLELLEDNDILSECFNKDAIKCPNCKDHEALFDQTKNISCPKCGKEIKAEMRGIS